MNKIDKLLMILIEINNENTQIRNNKLDTITTVFRGIKIKIL